VFFWCCGSLPVSPCPVSVFFSPLFLMFTHVIVLLPLSFFARLNLDLLPFFLVFFLFY
jgi:hypothetical protein